MPRRVGQIGAFSLRRAGDKRTDKRRHFIIRTARGPRVPEHKFGQELRFVTLCLGTPPAVRVTGTLKLRLELKTAHDVFNGGTSDDGA